MKLEVMLRRSKFRDYYDLYCIFQQDPDVMKFVKAAGDYSNHLLKSKHFWRCSRITATSRKIGISNSWNPA